MKYFSPNILDGSVTTAKLADNAVTTPKLAAFAVTGAKIAPLTITAGNIGPFQITQSKISSTTTSQSGSITGSAQVLVTMDIFTFFPDIEAAAVGDEQPLLTDNVVTPAASADTPQFRIDNSNAAARLYSVEWRHISA